MIQESPLLGKGNVVPNTLQQGERHPTTVGKERRKYLRVQVAIPVEFTPEGSPVATHAQTSDISVGGCYVEMDLTLPVGTQAEMALWLGEEKVWVMARIVTHHPYFGNGFAFTYVSQEVRSKLMRFLSSVAN